MRKLSAAELMEVEAEIRAACDRGAYDAAATSAIGAYGPELLGFLMAIHRGEAVAGDVFSQACEDLWNGLPRFRWQSSFRTWAYTLARHASHRHLRSPHHRRLDRLEEHPGLAELAQAVRTTTVNYLRSELKDQVTRLREGLEPEDQALLILRVDRDLPWSEIAQILLEDEEPAGAAAVARKAAALRKRFERVKEQLKRLAQEQQLLPED